MTQQGNSPLEDPFNTLLMGILMGFSNGLWKVSGEGSGGVTRAFGEDLWKLTCQKASLLGLDVDRSNPEVAMGFFAKYLKEIYDLNDSMDYAITDDTAEMTITNCRMHPYTDNLEANGVPRSCGCLAALVGAALMEDVTGEPYLIDNVKANDGVCNIALKKF